MPTVLKASLSSGTTCQSLCHEARLAAHGAVCNRWLVLNQQAGPTNVVCQTAKTPTPPHLRFVRLPEPFFGGALPRRFSLSSFTFFLQDRTRQNTNGPNVLHDCVI